MCLACLKAFDERFGLSTCHPALAFALAVTTMNFVDELCMLLQMALLTRRCCLSLTWQVVVGEYGITVSLDVLGLSQDI